jgi:hypothetical protein
MARVICIKCSYDIKLDPDADEGSIVVCEQCKAELKLVTDGEYLQTAPKEEAA